MDTKKMSEDRNHFLVHMFLLFGAGLYSGLLSIMNPLDLHRMTFFEQSPELSYREKLVDQVPTLNMYLISIFIPVGFILIKMVCMIVYYLIGQNSANNTLNSSKSNQSINIYIKNYFLIFLGLLIGLGQVILFTQCITNTTKNVLARPRPIFFDQCDYQFYHSNMTAYNELTTFNKLGDYTNCKINDPDSVRSFPSGHASTSFAGLMFAFYMIRFIFNTHENFHVNIGNVLSIAPLYLAGWISITRVQDMKHHVDDVLGGVLIGVFVSVWVWNSIYKLLVEPIILTFDNQNNGNNNQLNNNLNTLNNNLNTLDNNQNHPDGLDHNYDKV
jgi:membrane-associated phospholipid phosphatase